MQLPTVLVVQHTPTEPAARLGEWLGSAGVLLDVRTPYDGTPLPDLDGYAGLLVLGGGMGAYDDEVAPWLPATRDLLRAAVGEQLPTLGVCLGAQLLAGALGGRVRAGTDGPEIGPGLVAKRDAAAADPLFRQVPFTPDVLHWHWDEISELPSGATLLASSPRYPHQAFRVGSAWGIQFHVETTPEMVHTWARADAERLDELGWDVLTAAGGWDLDTLHADLAVVWTQFGTRFADLVREKAYAARA